MEKINIKTATDQLVTALSVYGKGDLDIRTVNPLGTDTIYDFSFYKNSNWMSGSLITDLTTWENLVETQQPIYAGKLTELKNLYTSLNTLNTTKTTLQGEYDALNGVRKVRIQQGLDISSITGQCNAKQDEINAVSNQIAVKNSEITAKQAELTVINDLLSFENNFTQAEILELQGFIAGSTYQNENFVQTDTMTNEEIQDMAQDLYDQAQSILANLAQARYTFTLNAANFVFVKDYFVFTNQLALGSILNLEVDDDTVAYPVLLEMILNYDEPDKFEMTFGNRLRLDNSPMMFTDLQAKSFNGGINSSFNDIKWNSFDDNYVDGVSEILNQALDAAKNSIISSSNQDIRINQNGIVCRRFISDSGSGTYSPEQLWITDNQIAITHDNWNSVDVALGKISTPSGSAWGLAGRLILGSLIAGNQLVITNENNSFYVDGAGVSLTTQNVQQTGRILLNALDGIKIQKIIPASGSSSGSTINTFWVDSQGNLQITGNLVAATGTFTGSLDSTLGSIGGWTITKDGLSDGLGNFINSDGNVHLGMLDIKNSTATFSGNIYADNLIGLITERMLADGSVTNAKIANLSADKINAGTLRAINIDGCNIMWGGADKAWMHETETGRLGIESQKGVFIGAYRGPNYGYLNVGYKDTTLAGNNVILGQSTGTVRVDGQLFSYGRYAQSENVYVGNKKLVFLNGLFMGSYGWNGVLPSGSSTGSGSPISVEPDRVFPYGGFMIRAIDISDTTTNNSVFMLQSRIPSGYYFAGAVCFDVTNIELFPNPANFYAKGSGYLTGQLTTPVTIGLTIYNDTLQAYAGWPIELNTFGMQSYFNTSIMGKPDRYFTDTAFFSDSATGYYSGAHQSMSWTYVPGGTQFKMATNKKYMLVAKYGSTP
jgi:hypothetical protein